VAKGTGPPSAAVTITLRKDSCADESWTDNKKKMNRKKEDGLRRFIESMMCRGHKQILGEMVHRYAGIGWKIPDMSTADESLEAESDGERE